MQQYGTAQYGINENTMMFSCDDGGKTLLIITPEISRPYRIKFKTIIKEIRPYGENVKILADGEYTIPLPPSNLDLILLNTKIWSNYIINKIKSVGVK